MGLFSFLKKKKPEDKIPTPPSPPEAKGPEAQGKEDVLKPLGSEGQAQPQQPPQPKGPSLSSKSQEPLSYEEIPAPRPAESMKEQQGMKEQPKQPQKPSEQLKAPRQVDDFGIPMKKEEFELPDVEMPKFKFSGSREEEEVSKAIKGAGEGKAEPSEKPAAKPKKKEEIPHELPDIGEEGEKSGWEESPAEEEWQQVGSEMPEGVEEPELKEISKAKGPVFMRSDNFMSVKKGLNNVKDSLKNTDNLFANMTEMKNKEDADLKTWHSSVEAMLRKMVYVDKTLFEKKEETG